MTDTFSFGEWVSQRRKTLDLTQRALAAQTNCALATMKKIEADERRPSRELADELASALQIPPDWRDTFIECARGLRPVDALADMQGGANGSSSPTAVSNLPAQSTPFIGREAELAQIEGDLGNPACRLLTLVGPGGIGKTRLAYQAAAHQVANFFSGAHAVPLAGVNTPDYLLSAIAERLKLAFFTNGDPKAQLLNYLREKHLLLALDNFEHLLDGAPLLAEILEAAPGVKILATSRERLNLSSEWLFPVEGLAFPQDETIHEANAYHAVQLFETSARRAQPGYQLADALPAVIDICKLVEGMPLAIELAASWVRRMPAAQIVTQIRHDLDFLAAGWRDTPERHRSLRALFEHSWRLLSLDEQQVLMKLSVFRGGFEPEAAQQIAGASLYILSALEDKSLIRGSAAGRYDLHELIRQFAESKLTQAGIKTAVQQLQLNYFMDWAETASEELHKAEQVAWARGIKKEYDNVRAALAWAFGGGDAEKGLRMTNGLWFYWFRWGGNWEEGLQWMERGLNQTEGVTPLRAEAFANAGSLAAQIGNIPRAIEYTQLGFEYSQQLNLKSGIARYILGMSYQIQDYTAVVAQFEQAVAIFRESGPRWVLATALFLYGDRARVQGDLARAQSLYDESLVITQADQNLMLMGANLERLGRLAAIKGDYQKARVFYKESTELVRQLEYPLAIAEYLIHLSALAIYQGDYESAEQYLKESLAHSEEFNNFGGKVHATYYLAELALHREQFSDAARLLADSFKITLSIPEWQSNFTNHEFNCERLLIAGKLACALGNYVKAAWLLGTGEAVRAQSNYLLDALPRQEYEQAVSEARAQLGDSEFAEVWREGQALSEADAIAEALAYVERLHE